jgi:hypothetical protein
MHDMCAKITVRVTRLAKFSIIVYILGTVQGCQRAYFQTKNSSLGKFLEGLALQVLAYFMVIWSTSWQFGIVYGHLVYFVVFWYIFHRFGMLYQEKSGNPGTVD